MPGHHLPPSMQGKWLDIDDQTNNILASLCLASYLAAKWLQKLETNHCVYYAEVISVLMCVCLCVCLYVCVWYLSLIIYNKTKLPFCKMSVFVPQHLFAMFKSGIMEVELDSRGKHDKTTDRGN